MPLDYTLMSLACWQKDCTERFDVFTDLSNHHLAHHEQPLNGEPVDVSLERNVLSEDCHICRHDRLTTLVCSRCGPECAACLEAQRAQETPVPNPEPSMDGWQPHSNEPAALSALQLFKRACEVKQLSYRELDARLLLDKLGVCPDAPVAGSAAAVQAAVNRWQVRLGVKHSPDQEERAPQDEPPAASALRWMWQSSPGGIIDSAHIETPGCVEAGCVPIGMGTLRHEP